MVRGGTADELAIELDRYGRRWDLYRGHDGLWRGRMEMAPAEAGRPVCESLAKAPSIVGCLALLVSTVESWRAPLPDCPRFLNYEIRRTSDSTLRWHVYENGQFDVRFPTRRFAEQYVQDQLARRLAAINEWHRQRAAQPT